MQPIQAPATVRTVPHVHPESDNPARDAVSRTKPITAGCHTYIEYESTPSLTGGQDVSSR
jgi:hypothetical protein